LPHGAHRPERPPAAARLAGLAEWLHVDYWFTRRRTGNQGPIDERGYSDMYIGVGTIVLILIIVLLIAFVF
jgi:hypothetical protein